MPVARWLGGPSSNLEGPGPWPPQHACVCMHGRHTARGAPAHRVVTVAVCCLSPSIGVHPPFSPPPSSLPHLQLGYNAIPFFDAVEALAALPHLSTLYLEHNPIARDFEYRMRLRRMIPTLTQLDATAVR